MTAPSIRRATERKAKKQARKAERSSTGTGEGKTTSCLNHTKHGLTGNFQVLQFESQEAFDELRNALRAEHQPATPTEVLLVDRLAEHTWLSQRAQKFADLAFLDHNEKMMALMLRYRTTHDRAFHKCLAELRTVRKERGEQQQFDSQKEKSAQSYGRSDEEQPAQKFESQASLAIPGPDWRTKAMEQAMRDFPDFNRQIDEELLRIAEQAETAR